MTEEEIQALQDTNKELTSRITQLESINISLVEQKKELKQKIENGVTDEELKAELDNYKTQLEQVALEKDNLSNDYEKDLNGLRMVATLKEMGVEAHNIDALNAVAELTLSDATYKDGGFVYLNEDGTTIFNDANQSFSVQDKVNALKESDKQYLFKQPNGGGATGQDAKPTKQNMTDDERARDMAKRLGQTA